MSKIEGIHYRDMSGELLWQTPMNLSRLWALGDDLIADGKKWIVRRVALADTIQHINVEPDEDDDPGEDPGQAP